MKLILSTSNIMGGGPSIVRRHIEKSNAELTNSLRANFTAAQRSSPAPKDPPQSNGTAHAPRNLPSYKTWTHQSGNTLLIPSSDQSRSGLSEERAAYDITLKLFYLPNIPSSRRCRQTREAVDLVLKQLHVPSIDLLIVSYPNIAFDADDEDTSSEEEELLQNGGAHLSQGNAAKEATGAGGQRQDEELSDAPESIDSMIQTWRTLEAMHDEGIIGKLGVAEFGTQRLGKFLAQTRIRPTVDQINVRDCCVVPKPLILFAKQEGIELLTHSDCTNILPRGTLRELLGEGQGGMGVLASAEKDGSRGKANADADSDANAGGGLKGDVEPQWVVKYTAVIKDRGVVESKGYFAGAELEEQ